MYVVISDRSGFHRIHHVCAAETVIGRASNCEICLPNDLVSRKHSLLLKTENGYRIRDLGSRNGTQLSGRIIDREEQIDHGAEILIGPYLLKACFNVATSLRDSANTDDSTRKNVAPYVENCKNGSTVPFLSPAQRRVYDLFLEGLLEKEVAVRLGISIHTVHFHAKSVYKALSVSTRGELILRWATQTNQRPSETS